MRREKGKLIVISGPSGAGKSTVIAKLNELRDDLCFSVSATTREPRRGETNGVDYFFVTHDEFDRMVKGEKFLEYATYVGNSYGTPRDYVNEKLEKGINVLLDIEVQGAGNVRESMPEAVLVFVIPDSLDSLEKRLRGRNTDSEEKIIGRLEQARVECLRADTYDYIVVNNDADIAARELDAIIRAEHCKTAERINYLRGAFK